MKDIIVLQNSKLSFEMDMKKITNPQKYNLHLIVNKFGQKKILEKNLGHYLSSKHVTEDFSYGNINNIIHKIKNNSSFPINIVTNSEETMPICGNFRVRYGIDNEDYSRFLDKEIMKSKLKNTEINVPKFLKFDKRAYIQSPKKYINFICNMLKFPLFLKPINQYGCLNSTKIYNKN